MSIHEKLLSIQEELKAPKGQHNDFGNFNYRSCEDILEAVKPLLVKHKAVLTISDEIINLSNRFYIKATAAIADLESNTSIEIHGYAREPESRPKMDEAQVTGSSSSYARKYALNGLFCIDDTKDPDTTNNGSSQGKNGSKANSGSSQKTQPKKEETLTPSEFHTLVQMADKKGVDYETICKRYGKKDLKELTSLESKKAMSGLSKMPDVDTSFYGEVPDGYQYDLPFR